MSSSVNSGKSARSSSTRIPPARYSSTSRTVIRIPRMHGCPLRFPGSMVMRCARSILEAYPPSNARSTQCVRLLQRFQECLQSGGVLIDGGARTAQPNVARLVAVIHDHPDHAVIVFQLFLRFRIERPFAIFPGTGDVEHVDGCTLHALDLPHLGTVGLRFPI